MSSHALFSILCSSLSSIFLTSYLPSVCCVIILIPHCCSSDGHVPCSCFLVPFTEGSLEQDLASVLSTWCSSCAPSLNGRQALPLVWVYIRLTSCFKPFPSTQPPSSLFLLRKHPHDINTPSTTFKQATTPSSARQLTAEASLPTQHALSNTSIHTPQAHISTRRCPRAPHRSVNMAIMETMLVFLTFMTLGFSLPVRISRLHTRPACER